jgi:hypothetical protein
VRDPCWYAVASGEVWVVDQPLLLTPSVHVEVRGGGGGGRTCANPAHGGVRQGQTVLKFRLAEHAHIQFSWRSAQDSIVSVALAVAKPTAVWTYVLALTATLSTPTDRKDRVGSDTLRKNCRAGLAPGCVVCLGLCCI